MPVFVTGGTGYVGRRLTEHLVSLGQDVRLLVRSTRNTAWLERLPVSIVPGDILDRDSLRQAMGGCDRIFHLAALVRLWARDPDTFHRVNVQGLRNVLDVALEVGVERAVYTSSMRAFGPTDGQVSNEAYQSRVRYHESAYDRSKRACECMVAEYVGKGLAVVIVNPTSIFGPPASVGRVFQLLKRLSRGQPIPIAGDGRAIENYVYIDDVVEGHLRALEKGQSSDRYILGGENLSFNELVTLAAEVVARPAVQIHLPLALLGLLAVVQEVVSPVLGREPSVTRLWVDTFRHDWAFSSGKAERELGYCARSVRSGLELTWRWMQEQGYAP